MAGQENPIVQQPATGDPEQRGGAEIAGPDLAMRVSQQRDVRRFAGEVPVAVTTLDLRGVLPARRKLVVAGEDTGVADIKPAGKGGDDRSGTAAGSAKNVPARTVTS